MTLYQTRQLGIEFERRVQAAIPSEEYINKLDTDTIYSFLNEYQMQFVSSLFNSIDSLDSSTVIAPRIENVLQSLLTSEVLDSTKVIERHNEEKDDSNGAVNTGRSTKYKLQDKCLKYIRSVSRVLTTSKYDSSSDNQTDATNYTVVPNIYATQKDVQKILTGNPFDSLRVMRKPVVTLSEYYKDETPDSSTSNSTLTVLYDRYTDIESINIVYYKKPAYFSLMTSTPCELPMEVFEDLVNGAVKQYISYATITQQNKSRREQEAARQQNEIDSLADSIDKLTKAQNKQ